VSIFFIKKPTFHKYSIACLLSRNILHKLAAPKPLLSRKNFTQCLFLTIKPEIYKQGNTMSPIFNFSTAGIHDTW